MKQRIPQLDVVRGIAILIVMIHNSGSSLPGLPLQSLWAYGWMGVDLFFVLSGVLITGDSPRFETIGGVLQELLREALSAHLASLLFRHYPDVCGHPLVAPARWVPR